MTAKAPPITGTRHLMPCHCCRCKGKACARERHQGSQESGGAPRGGTNRYRTTPRRPHIGLTPADIYCPFAFPSCSTNAPHWVMPAVMPLLPQLHMLQLSQLLRLLLGLPLPLQYQGQVKDLLRKNFLGRLRQSQEEIRQARISKREWPAIVTEVTHLGRQVLQCGHSDGSIFRHLWEKAQAFVSMIMRLECGDDLREGTSL